MKIDVKKLAEWAGFTDVLILNDGTFCARDPNTTYDDHFKQFPQSLDVCFKWFKPKFKSIACGSLNEDNWRGAWAKVITHEGETAWVREENIEPVQALCLAVEKLVDSKRRYD